MDPSPYAAFLEGKIKDEHEYTHLLEEEVTALKERVGKLLKDIAALRKSENELRMRSRQAEERVAELHMELKKAKEIRNTKAKETTETRERKAKEQAQEGVDHKQIFRSYLDNTFPRNKGTIKRLLKVFYVLEEREGMQPLQKIKFYQGIFEGFVKRVLDWIFPKKTAGQMSQSIAQNLMKEWKEKGAIDKKALDTNNTLLLREADYIRKIQKLQAEMLMLRSSKSMVENRLKTYERGMQIKGGQFVVHLKKMLQEDMDLEPQSHQKVEEIMTLFASASRTTDKKEEKLEQGPLVAQQIPLILTDKSQNGYRRKTAPILKKNIYGYYQDPQFAGNYTIATPTKHGNPHKQTQTLPQDLCVLTLHPVILLTLIDGNIKPQRTRHSSQYYVRIKVNQQIQTDSTVRESLEPVWNEPFLLKDYDFPFIHVSLMHKSKGLRDYAIGMGKLSASKQEQKIVNIRKDKQFQGRVRFSLGYPRGNIYQLKITSVRLEIPSEKIILKEEVTIKFPYNPLLSVQFVLPEQVAYIQRSMIILESSEESMSAQLVKTALIGQLPLKEILGQQGNKEVVVEVQGWKVIIQGELYLLICEEEEPEVISEQLLQGGKGKYFSVRAPPPIVTVTYADILLHSNIKFPLVYALRQDTNRLTIIKELSTREIVQQIVEPILNKEGCLRLSQFIKAPAKIYKFFIETLQGEEVRLKHESHVFQRLLKEIDLQVSYREDEAQEVDYARKHRSKKENLFKEFTIQSKELMLNHYKVFSRHFKRIGFVKFKLGYTIYDNELLYENVAEAPIKDSRRLEPIQQGTYFIQLQLSQAHLVSKSPGSAYRCVINGETSSEKKGNHPQWGQAFIVSFQFLEVFQAQVKYEVWQEGTFGKTKIYDGFFIINDKVMALGTTIISLDTKGEDCLHFSRIAVPSSMIRLSIGQIQAQIKEDADWIGKIDPYIRISSKNRQLIKTEYLDNKGSHPVWPNINKDIIISRADPSLQISEEDMPFLECKVFDYDLVGRDDYLGEVRITARLNSELMNAGQSQIIYGNLVKDNFICGSVRLKGSFESFTQQRVDFSLRTKPKLSKNDVVYRLSIFKVRMNNWGELRDDKGIATIKVGDSIIRQEQFQFRQLEKITLNHWLVNNKTITIQFKRQYKSFFKTFTQSLGIMTLQTSGRQLLVSHSSILNAKNQEIGVCHWYFEPQDKVNYASFGNFTSCKQQIVVRSDLEHKFILNSLKDGNRQPFVFYHNNLTFSSINNQITTDLSFRDVKLDIYDLYQEQSDHQNMVGCFTADMTNTLETKLQQKSQRAKADQSRQYKQLTSIHWQPYQYQTTTAYEFNLRFTDAQPITLRQELQSTYNQYLPIKPFSIPVIFSAACLPNSVEIVNSRTRQVQANLPIQEQTKIFVPNKGVLYSKIEDYNLKSIMELQLKHILIRFRDQSKFKNCPNPKMILTSSLSLNTFTCELMPETNSFLLQGAKMLIADPLHSATAFFFQAVITDKENRQIFKGKFGLKLQTNKEQIRIVDNSDYIVHASFSCLLIERNYSPPAQKDNTIYGMSFIQLQEVEFEVNQDPSTRHIFLEFSLSNQYLKLYLQKVEGGNMCKANLNSIFFIERSSIAEMSVIQQGVLSNSVLGNASVVFSETFITKEKVSVNSQVRKDKKIIGRINIKYSNLKEIPFIDVDMFTFISKANAAMVAQLQQFGPNKQKYQRMALTSRGDNVARLQSEDSFIVTKDPREYEITVNERDTNKLLGEFKLCHELQAVGDRITVLQPLRTSMSSLNGLLIIQYASKQSNTVTWDQTKDRQILLMELSISKLALKKHNSRLGNNLFIRLRTALRENKTNMMKVVKPSDQNLATFTIYNNESCEIAILDKTELLGTTNMSPPYCQNQERVIVFAKDSQSVGICSLRASYIKKEQQYTKMREISTIQAGNLIDTETFSKMTPYIELQSINRHIGYATELGLGKEKIFWKVNLMSSDALKLTVKDKDMFFDDLIGSVMLDGLKIQQLQDKTIDLFLQNAEEGKLQGNGILKVTTTPIAAKFDLQSITPASVKEVQFFMLQLGGLLNDPQLYKTADSLEIYLGSGETRVPLLKEFYDDVYFYLSNKDVQLEFDAYFMGINKDDLQISISLCNRSNILLQQKLSSKPKGKAKDLFTVCNIIPLEKEFFYFQKIYLWMLEKIPSNLEVFLSSQNHLQRLRITCYQKYLIVLQPYQLCSYIDPKHPLNIILRKGSETILQVSFTLDRGINQNSLLSSGGILDQRSKEVGFYYAQMSKFVSEGQKVERKTMIGKSRRKWLTITINQAILTKDLQIFSKMDPYCKFGPADQRQNWRRTSVQDNVGLHPIWNQSFFIQLVEGQAQQFGFVVMDEQVTADRVIGEGRMSVLQLMMSGDKEIELFYKPNEISGNLKVQTFLSTGHIIFRDQWAAETCEFYLFHQANKIGEAGVKIQLGASYVIDPRKEIRIRVRNTTKKMTFNELKQQQVNGIAFGDECAWLHYDIYE